MSVMVRMLLLAMTVALLASACGGGHSQASHRRHVDSYAAQLNKLQRQHEAAIKKGLAKEEIHQAANVGAFAKALGAKCALRENGVLPDPRCTPGAINHAVTQRTIRSTICKAGWTRTIRPDVHASERLKAAALKAYGMTDFKTVEADHLISLELGGAPADPRNIWPEPHSAPFGGHDLGSWVKDGVENGLKALVCERKITLAKARRIIRTDWTVALP